MTRTERTPVESTENKQADNSLLRDIMKEATQSSQEMLRATNREVREVTYNYDNPLEIPEELEKRMRGEGYELRWLRFKVKGVVDTKNITKRLRQGYTLVIQKDVPEMSMGALGGNKEEFVLVEDSVLGKISVEDLQRLKTQIQDRANYQESGVKANFREQALANRLDPNSITDSSRTIVSGGSGVKRGFADDR